MYASKKLQEEGTMKRFGRIFRRSERREPEQCACWRV